MNTQPRAGARRPRPPTPRRSRRPLGLRALALPLLALGLAAPTSSAGDDDVIHIQFLANTGVAPAAKAKARLRLEDDSTDFKVELEQIASGTYALFVGGVQRGDIQVGAVEGEIEFEIPLDPPKPLLDFEVQGQAIEVRQGDTVFFSDVFDGVGSPGGGGGGGGAKTKTEVFMVNVGPDTNAKGRLRHETKPGETRFKVNVQQLQSGDDVFQLFVGDTERATFDTTGVHEVELDFRNPPDDDPDDDGDDGELELHFLLDFEPLGQQVEVRQGEVVFLSGMLPGQGAVNAPKKPGQAAVDLGKRKGDALQVRLLDLGVIAGAQGKLELEQHADETEFEVEVEDLPDATYALHVGGAFIADLVVVAGQGELDFSTQPEVDELLLDFAVKGQLVQILLDGDAVLATVFPMSVPEALGKAKKEQAKPNAVRRNLVNAGVDLDTDGLLRWKQKKNGSETLVLRTRDLPPGTYVVRVGGVERGSFEVTKQDGPGKLRFKTGGKGKSLPLEFPVAGETVEVLVDGEVLLSASVE